MEANLSIEATVICGPETAARLGVEPGTEIPLGVLAATDPALVGEGAHPLAHMLRGQEA